MMKYIIAGVMSVVVCSAVPVAVSAESLLYRGAGYGVSQHWFERNSSLYKVFDDRFGMPPRTSYYGDTVRDQPGERSVISTDQGGALPDLGDTGRSLSPSADVPGSVHGFTGGPDRPFFLGSQSEADPMVQDLSRMNGGGFSSPGGGSAPGYHGR